VINTLMLMPIRLLGFVRMAHNAGWGTRAGGFSGASERNWRSSIPPMMAATIVIVALVVQR
jgi:hyaluronan synthase